MITLIKREIESIATYVMLLAGCTILIMRLIAGTEAFRDLDDIPLGTTDVLKSLIIYSLGFLPFIFALLGANQISSDRNSKAFTFLCTLATNRERIIAAKIITGIFFIFLIVAPVAIFSPVIFSIYPPVLVNFMGEAALVVLVILAANLTGYAIGLLLGWDSGKIIPIFGVVVLTGILLSVIMFKGVSLQTVLILLVVTAVVLTRVGQKFMNMPL